jgi:hypothetical protein
MRESEKQSSAPVTEARKEIKEFFPFRGRRNYLQPQGEREREGGDDEETFWRVTRSHEVHLLVKSLFLLSPIS